jgi:hypothetical protein
MRNEQVKMKFVVSGMALLLINLVCATSAPAKPSAESDADLAAKVKASIVKIGTGPAALVELKLRDGSKLKGYVSEANDRSFVIVDNKTRVARDVPYPQVKRVKGNNLSTGAKVAIGFGIGVWVLFMAMHFGG